MVFRSVHVPGTTRWLPKGIVTASVIAVAILFTTHVETLTPSSDGTTLPPATQLVDNVGAIWTIASNGAILRNGAQAAAGWGSKIYWTSGTIYVYGTDSNWWRWSGSGWVNVGSTTPALATSVDGTVVPTNASQVIDSSGAIWTIASNGAILRNGAQAAAGWGSKIYWTSGTIYVYGTDGNWWRWMGGAWTNVGSMVPTHVSPNPSIVPATTNAITDSAGHVWTIGSLNLILLDGVQAGNGLGSEICWTGGMIDVLGTDNNWWQWTNTHWTQAGSNAPAGCASNGSSIGSTTTTVTYNPHPRIWYGPKLATLRVKAAANDPDWLAAKAQADALLAYTVAPYDRTACTSTAICYTYEGTGWESAAGSLTFAAAVTGARVYCDKALEIAAVMNAATAAGNLDPIQADSGFPSRSAAKALGLIYDTCGSYMDATTTSATFATMNAWFDWVKASALDNTGPAQSNYFGGHLLGMGIMGLASAGENPRGQEIADWAQAQFNANVDAAFQTGLFQGGYLIEGSTYGANNYVRLLSYMAAVKSATNVDLAAGKGYGPRLVQGLIYQFKPNGWQVGDEADMPGDWVGVMDPTIMLMLPGLCAGRPEAGYAQWLYQHLVPPPNRTLGIDPVVRLLWYDGSIPAVDYRTALPTTYRSAGDNHVITRSDWTGNAVWTSFAAGSEWWTGHQLKWAGHLTIARGPDYLLVNSGQWKGQTGYAGTPASYDFENWRANTLDYPTTWTGGYQGGQGAWGASRLTGSGDGADYIWTSADVTSAYTRVTDVTLALRTVVTFTSGTTVVFTRVAGSQMKTLNWHGNLNGKWQCTGSVCTSTVGSSKLTVTSIGHTLAVAPDPVSASDGTPVTYRAFENDSTPDATFIDVFEPTDATATPLPVWSLGNGAQVGSRIVMFDSYGMPTVN